MKKIFGLLILVLLLNGCDDGNVTVQNIGFSDIANSSTCNGDIVYKINGNQALIIKITNPITLIPFANTITDINAPLEIPIDNTNLRIIYRNYNGAPSGANICDSPPAATPSVTEEWYGIGGTMEVTTTAIKSSPDANNATKITGYNHYIVFKNITFQKPEGTQTYGGDGFIFGNYVTLTTLTYPFGSQLTFNPCTGTPPSTLYTLSGNEGVSITNINPSLLANTVGTYTDTLGTTANTVTYSIFDATIPNGYFCATTTPATPVVIDQWKPDNTITSGTIQVITTNTAGAYTHQIHLLHATLAKTGLNFYLGDDCYLGDYVN